MNYFTEERMRLIKKSYQFFLDKLNIRDHHDIINVIFHDDFKDNNVFGDCTTWSNKKTGVLTKIRIRIRPVPTVTGTIETLAHEMVHAHQKITGKLSEKFMWHMMFGFIPLYRKKVHFFNNQSTYKMVYWERPYEIEARREQIKLTKEFMKELENENENGNCM